MRRVILLALLALALPTASLAGTIDYAGFGSSTSGTASVTGTPTVGGSFTITLGMLSVNGGAFTSGVGTSVITMPTLGTSCGAGCFNITGGSVTVWSGGVSLFSSTFTSGTVTVSGGIINVSGFLVGGSSVATVINTGANGGILGSSDTIVTPEPGTLGLLGTGLVGLAGLVRRKLRS
jgi:PEP-CTERM motif